MAEASISSVIDKLSRLFNREIASLVRVEHQVEQIIRELRSMREILRDAEELDLKNYRLLVETVNKWVEKVRDMTDDAEVVIDTLMVVSDSQRRRFFKRYHFFFNYSITQAKVRKSLDRIMNRMPHLSHNVPYKITKWKSWFYLNHPGRYEKRQLMRRNYPCIVNERALVGREEDIKAIKDMLIGGGSGLHKILIFGMAGTGKTCLAAKIFNSDAIATHFENCAWISWSVWFSTREFVQEIWEQVTGLESKTNLSVEEELRKRLCTFLRARKYLVVIDNVQTPETWTSLRECFPDESNGSRIVFTSRSKTKVSLQDDSRMSRYHLGGLSDAHSWELLTTHMKLTIPPYLEELGRAIVEKCRGLPIAIKMLSDHLLKENIIRPVWSRVLERADLLIGELLWPRLLDLPLYLTRCLSYFGLFPHGFEIPVRRLIGLWIAEGFVRQRGDEPVEKAAEEYLQELIDYSMIQVSKQRIDGRPKTCCLLPVLREHYSSKAKEVLCGKTSSQSLHTDMVICRLVDHGEISKAKILHAKSNVSSPMEPYRDLVSFFSFDFQEGSGEKITDFIDRGISSWCFQLLRVLDLERVYKPKLPKALGKLINLRYLGLRWTYLDTLPASIGDLFYLQTLDVKHTYISTYPDSIWKMQHLRHLFLNESYRGKLVHRPTAGSVKNLQTLWGIFVDEECPVEDGLDRLINLTRLGLSFNINSQAEAMAQWIVKLKHLQSLRLRSKDEQGRPSHLMLKHFNQQRDLTDLYLFGRLDNPLAVYEFPPNLTNLTLSASRLQKDPMPVLEKLPNLSILKLFSGSYIGKDMVCSSRGFPLLQSLKIWKLEELEEWTVEDGAMPILKELEIRSCENLKILPMGLQQVTTLRELKLTDMPEQFTKKVKENEIEDWYKKAQVQFVHWN